MMELPPETQVKGVGKICKIRLHNPLSEVEIDLVHETIMDLRSNVFVRLVVNRFAVSYNYLL